MLRTNYHTHCDFCDGKGPALKYYESAKDKGLAALGYSSHSPLPFENDFAVTNDALSDYINTINKIKRNARLEGGPQVYLGLEIDFIPDVCEPRQSKWDDLQLDYKLASVHALRLPAGDKPMLAVDSDLEDFTYLWSEIYQRYTRAMVRDYFERITLLCRQGKFDVLGHYDLIKKNNPIVGFLDESADYYREAAIDTLDEVKKSDVILEINTGGIARGAINEIYPAPWILKEAHARGIPIQINADAHLPQHVDFYFEESRRLALAAGYKTVKILLDGKWQDRPL